jgi:hypothetical protein
MLFCSETEFLQASLPPSFSGLDYPPDHHHHQQFMKPARIGETSGDHHNSNGMVDYLLSNPPPHHHQHQQQQQQQQIGSGFCGSSSFDKLSFADVMQFADFGPKLALNQSKISEEESGIDPVYFLKFPVLNDKLEDQTTSLMVADNEDEARVVVVGDEGGFMREDEDPEEARVSDNTSVQLRFLGEDLHKKNPKAAPEAKNKRKRPRSIKTTEEVESQRMTHIAVERNRRKQMNEHLRVLRSLMPGSYVQRVSNISRFIIIIIILL